MEDDELNTRHQVESTASALSSDDIELRRLHRPAGSTPDSNYSDVRPWATKGVRNPEIATFGETDKGGGQRHKDAKAQEIMGEALFGGYCNEIEDLEPTERDALVNVAFQHKALRAKRPNVWVPRDDLGVSDDEVQRMNKYCMGHVWITNKGAALDSKSHVMYGTHPPA